MGDQLPTGQLSVVPWRRTGVKYTNNEAYFDVVEEIDAIIDKSGGCPEIALLVWREGLLFLSVCDDAADSLTLGPLWNFS